MITITREELESERIIPMPEANIYCQYDNKCTRAGQYMRCGTDLSALCPFYASHHQQSKRRESAARIILSTRRGFDAEG